jgi:hypothetical protein
VTQLTPWSTVIEHIFARLGILAAIVVIAWLVADYASRHGWNPFQ